MENTRCNESRCKEKDSEYWQVPSQFVYEYILFDLDGTLTCYSDVLPSILYFCTSKNSQIDMFTIKQYNCIQYFLGGYKNGFYI